jgi:pimeloyl-ACP methyl ester carboxylesterase
MLRKILIGLGVVVLLAGAGAVWMFARFSSWEAEQVKRLESGSKVAKTAKGAVEYALSGSGKHTILFVHGTPGGYDQGVRLADAAKKQGHRLLRVSRPGYLRTPIETGEAPEAQADAYAALLDTLGIEKVSVMGISGGGPSSAQFCARHPARCEALFLLSAVTKAREKQPNRPPSMVEAVMRGTDFGGWLALRGVQRNPEGAIKRLVTDPENQKRILSRPEQRAAYVTLAEGTLVLPTHRGAGAFNDRRWFTEMPPIPLASIRAPTLAVHGDADQSVPIDHAEEVVKQVPGAELIKIAGGDHFITLTHPEEVFGPVFERIARLDAQPSPVAAASP